MEYIMRSSKRQIDWGGGILAQTKRIMISLPDSLLKEVDGLVAVENRNRSELIREAMHLYLQEIKRQQIREKLKQGYLEMAETNLGLAKEALSAENEAEHFWQASRVVGGKTP